MADQDSTAASKPPAFQFYPNDFLSDSNVIVMSLPERGAYITLICFCWLDGSIPADMSKLARLCHCSRPALERLWPALECCFRAVDGGRLIHPRIERERRKQEDYREQQAAAGRRGAGKRWPKRNSSEPIATLSNKDSDPIVSPMAKTHSSSSSSSSDFSQERKERVLPARTTSGVMAGMLPRDHLNCRPPCIRVCLSQRQHVILRARHGGDETSADQSLDAFYREVRAQLPDDQPIGDRPWEFWDKQFAARFGTTTVNNKTAGNRAAVERFIARGKS